MIITPVQAVRMYNSTPTPPAIGSLPGGDVYGESVQSAMANFLDLPFTLSEGESSKLASRHEHYIKKKTAT